MSHLIKSQFVLICCIIASCPDSRVYSHSNHRVITIFSIVPLSTQHKAYPSSVSSSNSFSFRVQNGKSLSSHHFLTGQDENTHLNVCFGEKRAYIKGKIHIFFRTGQAMLRLVRKPIQATINIVQTFIIKQ